jgi:hypothetical protein
MLYRTGHAISYMQDARGWRTVYPELPADD